MDPEIGKAGDLDTAIIVLRFRNGVIGTIDNCRQAAYGYDQRAKILGSAGKIATDNCYPNQATVSTGQIRAPATCRSISSWTATARASPTRCAPSCGRSWRTSPPPVTGVDGRIPVVMGLAARKSVR